MGLFKRGTRRKRTRKPAKTKQRRLNLEILEDRTLLSVSVAGVPQWTEEGPATILNGNTLLGPAPNQTVNNVEIGAVQALAVSPVNPNIILAGATSGGVWLTTDGGNHWSPQTDQFPSLCISSIAFSPLDATGHTIFAATGNFSSGYVFNQVNQADGVLEGRLHDDGTMDWTQLPNSDFLGKRIARIVPTGETTNTGQLLLAAVVNGGGVYRSVDDGKTWKNILAGDATDLVLDPVNPDTYFAALPKNGIYRSSPKSDGTLDFGADWTPVDGSSVSLHTDVLLDDRILLSLTAADAKSYALWASIFRNDTTGMALYQSTDAGKPGTPTWSADIGAGIQPFPGGEGSDVHGAILADPTHANIVYVGGNQRSIFQVFADGTSVSIADVNANNTHPHADSRIMIWRDPTKTTSILRGDDGGVYELSNPDGNPALTRQWSSLNGDPSPPNPSALRITEFMSVAYDSHADLIFGGAQDNAVPYQLFTDNQIWSVPPTPGAINPNDLSGDGNVQAVDNYGDTSIRYSMRNSPGLFVPPAPPDSGFFVSRFHRMTYKAGVLQPGGDSLVQLANPTTPTWVFSGLNAKDRAWIKSNMYDRFPFVLNSVLPDKAHPQQMLIGYNGLYESAPRTLAGEVSPPGDLIIDVTPAGIKGVVRALAYGGMDNPLLSAPDIAYVGTSRGQLWVRETIKFRDGRDFDLRSPPQAKQINDIVLDPNDWRAAALVTDDHVWLTTDAGKSWTDITGNLKLLTKQFNTIEVFRHLNQVTLLVGTADGVYRTVGTSVKAGFWTKFGGSILTEELPNVQVSDLHYDPTDDILIAGTFGRGAWVVKNASKVLTADPVLTINIDDDPNNLPNVITLKRDADNPLLLDIDGGLTHARVPLNAYARINVHGTAHNDTLIIDTSNGNITFPGSIYFDIDGSKGGTDAVQVRGSRFSVLPMKGDSNAAWIQAGGHNQSVHWGKGIHPPAFNSPVSSADTLLDSARGGLQVAASSNWSEHVADGSIAGEKLAALDGSLGDALNGASFTQTLPVADPPVLQRIIETGTGAFDLSSVTSLDDLRDKLDALDDIPGNVSYTNANNVLRFDMTVQKTLSGQALLDVSALSGAVKLNGTLDLSADVTVHLIFGVDDSGFFIDPASNSGPELVVSNVRVTGDVTGQGQLGFLGVTLSGGTLTLDPGVKLTVKLHAPSNDSNGLIRLDDLTTDDISTLASASLTGAGSGHDLVFTGTFGVAALAPGLDAPFDLGSPQVTLTWPDITKPTNIQFSAAPGAGQDLLNFLNVSAGQYISGLTDLAGKFQAISGVDVLGAKIPLVNKSLGDILKSGPQTLNIQASDISGITVFTPDGGFNKFEVSLTGINPFNQSLAVGDAVSYLGANGQQFQGQVDSLDTDRFVVRYAANLTQDPNVTNPSFQITHAGSLQDQINSFLGGLQNDISIGTDRLPTLQDVINRLAKLAGVDPSAIGLTTSGTGDSRVIEITPPIHIAPITFTQHLDFGTAIAGLNVSGGSDLNITVAPTFNITIGLRLGSGLSATQRFYIATSNTPTISLAVTANLADPHVQANLGFLSVKLANDPAVVNNTGITIGGTFTVNLVDPGTDQDGRISLDELNLSNLTSIFNAGIDAKFNIDGLLVSAGAGVNTNLGSIKISLDGKSSDMAPGHFKSLQDLQNFLSNPLAYINVQGASDFLDFNNLTPQTLLNLLGQLGGFLESFRGSSVFTTKIPFAHNETLGNVLDFEQALQKRLTGLLVDDSGIANFNSAQELAGKMAADLGLDPKVIAANYDSTTKELTFHVKLAYDLNPVNVPIDLGLDLGPLKVTTSGTTLNVGGNAGLEFTFGINISSLQPVLTAGADAPSNGQLSGNGHFTLTVDTNAAVSVTVPVNSKNASIDGLVADINTALTAAGLTSIKAGKNGNRITLTDTNLSGGSITIHAASGDPTLTQLGFSDGQTVSDNAGKHFFVKDVSLTGAASLQAPDIEASARLGFLGIAVVGGSGAANASIALGLHNPANFDGRLTLADLFGGLSGNISSIVTGPTITGSANLALPIQVTPNIIGDPQPAKPEIDVTWSDINHPSLTVTPNADMNRLLDFKDLSFSQMVAAFGQVVNYLTKLQQFSFLNDKLPLVNKSVSDLLDYANKFAAQLQAFENNPTESVQDINLALKGALGLPPDSPLVNLSLDGDALKIQLALTTSFQDQLQLNLNLGNIPGLSGVSNLVGAGASGNLTVQANATLNLDLGIDLASKDSNGNPNANYLSPFLYDDTGLTIGAQAVGSNLNFHANIGPLDLSIINGSAVLDNDGVAPPGPNDLAQFTVALVDNGSGRTYLSDLINNLSKDVQISLVGQAKATFPVYFPTATNFLGNIQLTISNLSNPSTFNLTLPDFSSQFSIANLINSLGSVAATGLDKVLGYLQEGLDSKVFSHNFPLIGSQLKKSGQFIDNLRTTVVPQLQNGPLTSIQDALWNVLGPSGLNVVADIDNDSKVDESDIKITSTSDHVQFNLKLEQDLIVKDPINFDIGLPALGLKVNGGVQVELHWVLNLGFGVSLTNGFYLDTSTSPALTVHLDATIPGLSAVGNLGPLQISAVDQPGPNDPDGSIFDATFTVSLLDPDDANQSNLDNELTQNEATGGQYSLDQVVNVTLSAAAHVDLGLVAGFGPHSPFPSLSASFLLDWTFSPNDPDMSGNRPDIRFNNVQLNLGEFFTSFVKPILQKIHEFAAPIQPVIDFLESPVPLISTLLGKNVTWLDLAKDLKNILPDVIDHGTLANFDYIAAVVGIIDLANHVPNLGPNDMFSLGSFDLGSAFDIRSQDLSSASPNITHSGADPNTQLGPAQNFFNQMQDVGNTNSKEGLSFPILQNPSKAFQLLLGQTVDLFTFRMPSLAATYDFQADIPFVIPAPVPIPCLIDIRAQLGAAVNLSFGFDSSGIDLFRFSHNPADLFSGFYVLNHHLVKGKDVPPQLSLNGNFRLGVSVGTEVFGVGVQVGVGGGLSANIGATLHDPDHDGRVYASEFEEDVKDGLRCTFDISGQLTTELVFYGEIDFFLGSEGFQIPITPKKVLLDYTAPDSDCYPDRFEPANDTPQGAPDLGVAPGIHLNGVSLSTATDADWYRFEVVRPESIVVLAQQAGLNLEVTDAQGHVIGQSGGQQHFESVTLENLAPGTYYAHVSGTGDEVRYNLAIEPAQDSLTHVYYVNDPHVTDPDQNSYYSLAPGNDGNDGRSPRTPKATVQGLLSDPNIQLTPNDVVVIDAGVFPGTAIINGADSGAVFAGAPGGTTLSTTGTALTLNNASGNLFYDLHFLGSGTGISLLGNSANNVIREDTFNTLHTGILIGDSAAGNTVTDDQFAGLSMAIQISGHALNNSITSVQIAGKGTGIRVDSDQPNLITGSQVSGGYGFYVSAGAAPTIQGNDVSQSNIGIYSESTAAAIFNNQVHSNSVGLSGSGAFGPSDPTTQQPNEVYANSVGISLAGSGAVVRFNDVYHNKIGIASVAKSSIYGNRVHDNATGLEGSDVFGPADWSPGGALGQANDIFNNSTGVLLTGGVLRFSRIHGNTVGIEIDGAADVQHNVVFRNAGPGILVSGAQNALIEGNTVYAPTGDAVHVQSNAADLTVHNNIFWSEVGYDLYISNDSQVGLNSDYNNLFTTNAGKLAWYEKDFTDLYDWQVETNLDNHSIGTTVLDPTLDDPQFVNLAGDDYHLTNVVSTSIAAGDPAGDFSLQPQPNGGRIELGAYGDTAQAALSAISFIAVDYPIFYADWETTAWHHILWHTYQVTGNLALEVDDASGNKIADIATVPASDGSFLWSPQASGIGGDNHKRYRIRITSVDTPSVSALSREAFAVPPVSSNYYVNDDSTAGDELTTATGDIRATGRAPDVPKSILPAILHSYVLGPGDVVSMDTGYYIHVGNVLLTSKSDLGSGGGATITGPNDPAPLVTIFRPDSNPGSTAFDIDDGNFVTLSHLTVTGGEVGIRVRNGSLGFSASFLTMQNQSLDGIGLDSGGTVTELAHITATNNGRYGIFVNGPIGTLRDSVTANNGSSGIFLSNPGDVYIYDNTSYGNLGDGLKVVNAGLAKVEANSIYANSGYGINLTNAGTNSPAVIGNSDLTLGLGNRVHDNGRGGIIASGKVLIAGNTVFGQSGTGIQLLDGTVADNVVHDNGIGIVLSSGLAVGNRVYHNAADGMQMGPGAVVQDNVVYSNALGIRDTFDQYHNASQLVNNLVYANKSDGILLTAPYGAGSVVLTNNTIYQPNGNAVHIADGSPNVHLRDNILWVSAGYDLVVPAGSETGFLSDYNDLYTTGIGQVGLWQGIPRADLAAWQHASLMDQNGLAQDPLFVNPVGADGVLGYSSAASDGRDDDFHVQSLYGSNHGGALAPAVNRATGLPFFLVASQTLDGAQSPTIDRGDPTDSYANEPAPNGGFINLGAYGNTSQASLSPAQYVLLTRPGGGELWPEDQTFAIRWRSQDFAGTVTIDLLEAGTSNPVLNISNSATNTGEYLWTIPDTLAPNNDYRIRVTRNDNSTLQDSSKVPFTIGLPIHIYYVNEGSVNADHGDWTTAPGNDSNDGLTPATPKASIQAILAAYNVGPGATILVDAGTYNLGQNIVLSAAVSRITIEGYYDNRYPGRGAVLNRGNTSNGNYVFQLTGATNLTLDHLSLTGGEDGVFAADKAGSTGLTVSNSNIYGNNHFGILLGIGNDRASIVNNRVHDQVIASAGVRTSGTDVTISGNTITHESGNGIYVFGARTLVSGNDVSGQAIGIFASFSGSPADQIVVSGNTVHGNVQGGIRVNGTDLATGNTVYGQTGGTGIVTSGTVTDNVVYNNYLGIDAGSGLVSGNSVYNNSQIGIQVTSAIISGNTVYGNLVGIQGPPSFFGYSGQVLNNLIYANKNAGINLAGIASVFNTTGGPIVNNTVYQLTGDAITISGNFSNVHLRNNILWVASGYDINVASDSEVGFQSDYNDLYITGTGKLGQWEGRDFISRADWFYQLGLDQHSISADPLFVNPADPIDDFHVQGNSLTIAAGAPADDFSNQPAPNGGRIELGAYGNTSEATTSSAHLVQVLSPNGLEKFQVGQPVSITWRTSGLDPTQTTVNVQLSLDGGNSWTLLSSSVPLDARGQGSFLWTPQTETNGNTALIRVTSNGNSPAQGTSAAPFLIANAGHDYYLNDSSTAGDVFTTAPGDNAASGKSPDHPMASLPALLSAYPAGPGDTIHVDAGTYNVVRNVVLDASHSGVRIEGPANGVALLNRNNLADGSEVIQLAGAQNVTLDRLSLTGGKYGIYAADGAQSTGLTVTNGDIYGNFLDGIFLGLSNDRALIQGNRLHDKVSSRLSGGGGVISRAADVTISGNTFTNEAGDGINVSGARTLVSSNDISGQFNGIVTSFSGAVTDQIVVIGNTVHDNSNYGLEGQNVFLLTGNVVYNQTTGTGIFVGPGGTAANNVVHDNAIGLTVYGLAKANRVYHNSQYGIETAASGIAQGNKVYSNAIGIGLEIIYPSYNKSQVLNNLVYSNTSLGIEINLVSGGNSPVLANNTVYQTAGDAIRILDGAENVHLRNNILWASSGYDLVVATSSENGFQSDYNDLYTTGTGKLGQWEGKDFTSRADWFFEVGFDRHSISADPMFVNRAGADGILGYDATTGKDGGLDDDFHVQASSPAINAGNPADDFSNQPAPNGGRIELGAYGNTAEAAISRIRVVQVLSPYGLEKYQVGQAVTITWRTAGLDPSHDTVNVELSLDRGNSWTTLAVNVGLDAHGLGSLQWTPTVETNGNTALIRVTANIDSQAQGTSSSPFLITNAGHNYYIDDSSTAGNVFTTAAGDNTTSGKSPDRPMAGLPALLSAYPIGQGDIIYVDTGTYQVVRNAVLDASHPGVVIEGPGNAVALLDRHNSSNGSEVIQLTGADNLTLDHLSLTGGQYGVYAANSAGSTGLTVTNSNIYGNSADGIFLGTSNDHARILSNRLHDQSSTNITLGAGVVSHAANVTISGNLITSDSGAGVEVSGLGTLVSGNDISGQKNGIVVDAYSGSADQIVVSGNTVHDNRRDGIDGQGTSTLNTVYNQTAGTGIETDSGGIATGNIVHDNAIGMIVFGLAKGNRVFHNSQYGIQTANAGIVNGNTVYSNSIGIFSQVAATNNNSLVVNNLVYANTNEGIVAGVPQGLTGAPQVWGNTVYQPTGNAVHVIGINVQLKNNILWVGAGYDVDVNSTSQSGFSGDYNLFYRLPGAQAHTGFWNNSARDALSDWQSASGKDAHSLAADPQFVNPAGNDGILGYTQVNGVLVDGSLDDNFYLKAGSPAIDRGYSWASTTDAEGFGRRDDPGTANQGSADYFPAVLGASQFAATGTTQTIPPVGDLSLKLPFSFPFYDGTYTTVAVSAQGYIRFDNGSVSPFLTNVDNFINHRMIAPLFASHLIYNTPLDKHAGIYFDTSVTGQVTVRWEAVDSSDNKSVNFAAVLFADGHIRFDYGSGNSNLQPVVGISFGGNGLYQFMTGYDHSANLANANSVEFDLKPGYSDIGAYEFRGDSSDTSVPTVTATLPAFIDSQGQTIQAINTIKVTFSKDVNPIDADAPATYELRKAGSSGFGSPDDVSYTLTPVYTPGNPTVTLNIASLDVLGLPVGQYRLRIISNQNTTIHDLEGHRLDGDGNGSEGGDYVRVFTVRGVVASGQPIKATEGAAVTNVLVATFTEKNPNFGPQNFAATVNWADGDTTANVSIQADAQLARQFDVFAGKTNPYAEEGAYAVSVTITDAGGSTDTANTIATVADVTAQFRLNAPTSVTAGSAFAIAITALEPDGDTATGYTGSIHFTSRDGQAILPADYTFTAADAGQHTFSVTLNTAGSQSLTASDTANSTITGSQTGIVVSPAAANSFIVAGYPSPLIAGAMNNFTVMVKDPYGNTVPDYHGTVMFGTSALKAILPGNYTFTNADAGVHTFSAALRSAGTQSITITDTANSTVTGTQSGIVVIAGLPYKLAIARFPYKPTVGVAGSFRVTAQDLYGNIAPTFADKVHFTSSDPKAVLPGDYMFVPADNGVHDFMATLKTAGNQWISVQDASKPAIVPATQFNILMQPAAASSLQVSGFPSSVIAGTAHDFTVTALDPYGNVATGYLGTVTFSSSDTQAMLPGDYTFTSSDAGMHTTFSATLNTPGTQSIKATDTVFMSTESGISVVSTQPMASASPPSPALGVAGQPLTFTFSASESGPPTTFTYSVDWGDGSTQSLPSSDGSAFMVNHAFPSTGSFTVSMTATDSSGRASLPASAAPVSITTLAMEADPYYSNQTALYVGGTPVNDNIAITPDVRMVNGNPDYGVKVGMNYVNYGSFFSISRVVVYSQGGNDIIKTAAQTIGSALTYVNVPVMFFAGGGNDVLNLTGSGSNPRTAIPNNVLVGGGGTDRLIGGQGRDILIGGSGASTLQAGSGGDILIGGTTSYDSNAAALAALLAEWGRTDEIYAQRTADLLNGGGLNGNSLLNTGTVQADSSINYLYGGAGLDWYFAGVLDLFNQSAGEVVTHV